MPGNPLSLGPSNFGPNFINTLFSSFRGTHFRLIGAPTTLRRTVAATHSISYNKLVRANINSPVSIFNSETVASSTIPSANGYVGDENNVFDQKSEILLHSSLIKDLMMESWNPNSFPSGYPEYSRLLPCPSTNLPPRIEHLVVLEKRPVCEYISKSLDLPPLYVADLIRFGAVYYALICPEPPVTATPEQVQLYQQFTSPELLLHRHSIKGKTFREAQKTFRVTRIEEFFEVGTYLRIHVHPKRFPRCYEIDWKSRILAVTESYVVLDKPAGTSVGGSSDNIEECCATFATRALGLTYPLLTTHQIDNCTEGCVVLARNKKYCSTFHKKIRDKMVKKLYLALAAAPVPRGIYTHYMRPFNFAPRLISEEYIDRWLLCRLEVLDCKEVPWPNSSIREKYQIEDCGWPVKNLAYECTVDLLTGRTHQIRAQFAACGAPIIGDSMYMPASLAEKATPNINPLGKCKEEYTSEDEKNIAIDNWIALHGKEPTVAIGLQACQISWDNGEHIYNAGSPWWR